MDYHLSVTHVHPHDHWCKNANIVINHGSSIINHSHAWFFTLTTTIPSQQLHHVEVTSCTSTCLAKQSEMVVRSTASSTKPPSVLRIPTKPVMAGAAGSTEAAEAQTKHTSKRQQVPGGDGAGAWEGLDLRQILAEKIALKAEMDSETKAFTQTCWCDRFEHRLMAYSPSIDPPGGVTPMLSLEDHCDGAPGIFYQILYESSTNH